MVHDMNTSGINKIEHRIEYDDTGVVKYAYYHIKNKIHRTDGPAMIWYYQNGTIEREYYYINSLRHRMNAPAVITYNGNGNIVRELYYINNIDITEKLEQAHYFDSDEHTKALIWSMI